MSLTPHPLTTAALSLLLLTAAPCQRVEAQVASDTDPLLPEPRVSKAFVGGDSVTVVEMAPVYVTPPPTFKTRKQQQAYMRLVRNVKTVLPIAKEARTMLIETAEYLETLPTEKERQEHIKRVEAAIYREYKPRMKRLTYSQGKLLIKLINRECNSSAYEALQAFLGPMRAGMWQAFAWAFGASLKKGYEPEGVDRLTERVVRMVEAGQL